MSFFNKKEEVLDLQLTQFGKQLLSQGKFKPIYYTFFDNNILYDSSYSGMANEATKNIEDRIQDQTPYCKTQYVFSSRETAMNSFVESNRTRLANEPDAAVLSFVNPAEQAYTQILPLGNSELGNEKAPFFSVTFLNGELSGNVTTEYSSSYSVQKIPQLNATITYKIKPVDISEINTNILQQNIKYLGNFNNTTFKISEQYLLLQILENNVDFEKENFEIESFLVETISGSTTSNAIASEYEQLTPLFFTTEYQPVTSEFINNFFEILIDEEIPKEIICESVARMKKLDYYLDDDYDCDDLKNIKPVNIYQSNITDDDIEKCEV